MLHKSARPSAAAFVALSAALLAGACAPSHTGTTYSPGEMQREGTVGGGRIIGVGPANVAGTPSGIGTIGGGVAGAVVGSSIGKGKTAGILGGVAGAIGGALLGNAIEQGVSRGEGTEFVIQRDDGSTMTVVQTNEDNLQTGDRVLIVQSGSKTRIRREGRGGMPDAPAPPRS